MSVRTVMSKTIRKFASSTSEVIKAKPQAQPDYEACIEILNGLQSNAQYLKSIANHTCPELDKLDATRKYLIRSGLSLQKLDELSVIHVAGTKGKGTTCAFSESILRHHGFKTGFFSSPHLLEVRERIRINGKPIEKNVFAESFWKIYQRLDQQKADKMDMPLYFRFLTIMAFTIFLEQKVDVAIVEVGIGGEYDCTNVLRRVPVVGISSLGIDHTPLLGETIESIAWNKGGIIKEGCRAFTVPQPAAAMGVLKKRAVEKKCQLEIVQPSNYKFEQNTPGPVDIINLNASLSVALCNAWVSLKNNNNLQQNLVKETVQKALQSCSWPGRFQVKHEKNMSFYLDGAHTVESIEICSKWFKNISKKSHNKRALMFNVTGNRDSEALLRYLLQCQFHSVVFVPNVASKSEKTNDPLDKCTEHKQTWLQLEQTHQHIPNAGSVEVFPSVFDAIKFLSTQGKYDLLATGSLHLIGAVLQVIEPNLNDSIS